MGLIDVHAAVRYSLQMITKCPKQPCLSVAARRRRFPLRPFQMHGQAFTFEEGHTIHFRPQQTAFASTNDAPDQENGSH